MTKANPITYSFNTLISTEHTNLGTPKKGMIIYKLAENWDNKLYLKPDTKSPCLRGNNTSHQGHLWWNTKI